MSDFTYGDMRRLYSEHGRLLVMIDQDGGYYSANPDDYWSAQDSDPLPDGTVLAVRVPEHFRILDATK